MPQLTTHRRVRREPIPVRFSPPGFSLLCVRKIYATLNAHQLTLNLASVLFFVPNTYRKYVLGTLSERMCVYIIYFYVSQQIQFSFARARSSQNNNAAIIICAKRYADLYTIRVKIHLYLKLSIMLLVK